MFDSILNFQEERFAIEPLLIFGFVSSTVWLLTAINALVDHNKSSLLPTLTFVKIGDNATKEFMLKLVIN